MFPILLKSEEDTLICSLILKNDVDPIHLSAMKAVHMLEQGKYLVNLESTITTLMIYYCYEKYVQWCHEDRLILLLLVIFHYINSILCFYSNCMRTQSCT